MSVGDHRTVCSPQRPADDRRPPIRGVAPPRRTNLAPPVTPISSAASRAVVDLVPGDDARLCDGRQRSASRTTPGVSAEARESLLAASYGCWPMNLMSIRRGSQRRLGRPSAVIAGATVTDSTVSVISRRQAARRFAGSGSLSMSSGPMTSLSPPSPSRARAASRHRAPWSASPRSPGWRAGPTSQARRAAGSCHRDPRWRVRSPRPPRGSAAARRASMQSAVAEYARTASSTSSSTRSALTAARRRHRFALVSPHR